MSAENQLGYQQITDLSAAVGLTIPAKAAKVWVQPETQGVRWRADGVDPTATVGMPIAAGGMVEFTIAQLAELKFIEQAASAKLNVHYFGG
jgi:hypothetical protein